MKVATWNIGGGFIYSNSGKYDEENLSYIISELKNINPEIICLQEIHNGKNNNQIKKIAKALNLEYFEFVEIADSHLKDNEKLSIGIISKYEIHSSKFFKLTNPLLEFIYNGKKAFSHDKGFLEIVIYYNGDYIRILSGHMVPFRKFNKDFLDNEFSNIRNEIEKFILDYKGKQIICADMNFNGNITKLLPKIFNNGYNSLIEDTFTTPKNRKYDKIIVSKDFETNNSDVLKGKADHYLCYADLIL